MKNLGLRSFMAGVVFLGIVSTVAAQDGSKPVFLNPNLPAEKRAADLVSRMTLEEKVSQLVNQSRAIPRLNVPAYDWRNEALHGVITNGSTEFPEPIGLGATFDSAGIHDMATAIATEGRIKHIQAMREGHSNIFEGLDFWAPNLNIVRDPRWGRGQETFGEDPYLTARLGVAFVTGLQGDDPRYYRAIATPKHFAVHSGPESTRHTADVTVSRHDELDTYLPAFQAAVIEGRAASVMCAYNSVNGVPACSNEFLLQDELRDKWGFKGYVVADCGAIDDIATGHHYKPTASEAAAISLKRGTDIACADDAVKANDDHDFKPYLDAVKDGLVEESQIDLALTRLFTARMKLGLFDPPELVPYSTIDENLLDSSQYRDLARKLADESIVLLKNDGVLPLKSSVLKIALVGPLADQAHVLLGNYSGLPSRTISIEEGLQQELPDATIKTVAGTQYLRKVNLQVPADVLTTNGKPGLKASYYRQDLSAEAPAKVEPLITRIDSAIDLAATPLPMEVAGVRPLAVRWEAMLTPKESGLYDLGMQADGLIRISVNGRQVVTGSETRGVETRVGRVSLEKGRPYQLEVEYGLRRDADAVASLVWSKIDMRPNPQAVAAAASSDVVVAVVGITSELEGEQMQVNEEGFKGGDRTSLELPKPEQELLEAVAATHKPLIVVLLNGSALGINWAKDHANAIIEAWYPGEEGGTAVAETLSGRNNPGGKLPVTFYKDASDLPSFDDYSMKNRTYRYFAGTPLFPFGYGLSYTTFSIKGLGFSATSVPAGYPLQVEATVRNTGMRAGDEVVQLYLNFPKVPGAPRQALRGFKRVHLESESEQKVRFVLQSRDLSMVNEAGQIIEPEGEYTITVGGGQPGTSAPMMSKTFNVKGSLVLPE